VFCPKVVSAGRHEMCTHIYIYIYIYIYIARETHGFIVCRLICVVPLTRMFFLPHKSSARLRNTKTSPPLQRNGIPLGRKSVSPTVHSRPPPSPSFPPRPPSFPKTYPRGPWGSLLRQQCPLAGSARINASGYRCKPGSNTPDRAKSEDRNEGARIDC